MVALGRRVDGGSSQTFAASQDWQEVLPRDEWVFLAATFDYDTGEMALYKNGRPLDGFYTVTGDPWLVAGTARAGRDDGHRPGAASRSAAASRRTPSSETRATAGWTA